MARAIAADPAITKAPSDRRCKTDRYSTVEEYRVIWPSCSERYRRVGSHVFIRRRSAARYERNASDSKQVGRQFLFPASEQADRL